MLKMKGPLEMLLKIKESRKLKTIALDGSMKTRQLLAEKCEKQLTGFSRQRQWRARPFAVATYFRALSLGSTYDKDQVT